MSQLRSRMGWMGVGTVMTMGVSLFVGQVAKVAAAPDEKPKTASKAEEPKKGEEPKKDAGSGMKLVKPWSEIGSLTEEQKTKIHDLHVKALAATNEIEKKEKADIMALLSDAQKTELKEATSKKKPTAPKEGEKKEADKPAAK